MSRYEGPRVTAMTSSLLHMAQATPPGNYVPNLRSQSLVHQPESDEGTELQIRTPNSSWAVPLASPEPYRENRGDDQPTQRADVELTTRCESLSISLHPHIRGPIHLPLPTILEPRFPPQREPLESVRRI